MSREHYYLTNEPEVTRSARIFDTPCRIGSMNKVFGPTGPVDPEAFIYTGLMATGSLEDERGVDVSQIRERLRLSPAERVDRLIEEVRMWDEIRAFASQTRS